LVICGVLCGKVVGATSSTVSVVSRLCVAVQITQGKVAYMSEMEDGRQRQLVADTSITANTWHNVTLAVSGQ